MRKAAAWVTAITAFSALMLSADFFGGAIGVPVRIEFGEPIVIEHQHYDEEKDSAFTTFGLATTIICGMLASRIGMAISAASWRGGVTPRGEIQFSAWLMGLSIYSAVGVLTYHASRGIEGGLASLLLSVLDLAFVAGIVWAMKTWHDRRLAAL